MDKKAGTPDGGRQADPAEPNIPRPSVPDRAESSLPPHLRPSVIEVPVTPGINRDAYESEASNRSDGGGGADQADRGYFSRRDVDHAIAASPAPDTTSQQGQSFQNMVDTGAKEGANFLRRLSVAVMGTQPSRESMSDIRAISPDLALTGNIISATFNIPHSLKYRKGADWVRVFSSRFSSTFSPFCLGCDCRTGARVFLPSLDELCD